MHASTDTSPAPSPSRLSYSKVNRFEQCPMSYKLHYLDKAKSDPANHLLFGIVVHETLERVMRRHVEKQRSCPIDLQESLTILRDTWSEQALTGLASYQEATEIVTRFVEDEGSCDPATILGIEQDFVFTAGDVVVVGKMDRVNRINDTTIEIVDYKTSFAIPSQEALDNHLQLSLYQLAAQRLWPWAQHVRLTLHMLRHGVHLHTRRSPEHLDAAMQYVQAVGERLRLTDAFPAKLGSQCGYCDHRPDCPDYAMALTLDAETLGNIPLGLDELAAERERIAGLAKLLDSRKRDLDEVIKYHLSEARQLVAAKTQYTLGPMRRSSYPLERTATLVADASGLSTGEVLAQVGRVDNGALNKLVTRISKQLNASKALLLQTELDAVADVSFTNVLRGKPVPQTPAKG